MIELNNIKIKGVLYKYYRTSADMIGKDENLLKLLTQYPLYEVRKEWDEVLYIFKNTLKQKKRNNDNK